ncbi:hypothetical protein N7481_001757 [Penicillium waksmanii]|uniref:uncharacterized protein n=1 Tax=Penicillium waksmanii TaxID=69791 RepID=UPI0025494A4E|nr:uncharacterized protein N7481_001757 [Penicillium waksmanii]KAJ5994780.1 hypothetical protein N7481_001757 [Penicillium waksmanii]
MCLVKEQSLLSPQSELLSVIGQSENATFRLGAPQELLKRHPKHQVMGHNSSKVADQDLTPP